MSDEPPKRSTGLPWYVVFPFLCLGTAAAFLFVYAAKEWSAALEEKRLSEAEESRWRSRPRTITTGTVEHIYQFDTVPDARFRHSVGVAFDPPADGTKLPKDLFSMIPVPYEYPFRYRIGDVVEVEIATDPPAKARFLRVLRSAPVPDPPASP